MNWRNLEPQTLVRGRTDRAKQLCYVLMRFSASLCQDAGCLLQVELNGWIFIGVLPIDQGMLGVYRCACVWLPGSMFPQREPH
jgi:hypothetical protein